MIGLKLAAIVGAASLALGAVGSFIAYGKGVEAERTRVTAERFAAVEALIAENLRTRAEADRLRDANTALAAAIDEKEVEVKKVARQRDQLWNRRADEDVSCAAWFDQPVACRLRDEAAADR